MDTWDLRARGFRYHATLPKAYTFCPTCDCYRWFGWWQAPDLPGVQVACCDTCGYLAPFEAAIASRWPIVRELHLVEK